MIRVIHQQHDGFEKVQALARGNAAARAFTISVDFSPKRLHLRSRFGRLVLHVVDMGGG